MKYIRGAKLLDGTINYNQVVVKGDRGNKVDFTYEDYKNSLKEKKVPVTQLNPNITVNRDVNPDTFSYDHYIKQKGYQTPIITKEENMNSNTDYIVDKMLNKDTGFLNFDTNSEKNMSQTVYSDENVYNPYSNVKLNEFKPVYKTMIPPDFNNVNNQFSNPNTSVHNMSIPSLTDLNKDRFKYTDSKFPK
jgi:hypothetical protein